MSQFPTRVCVRAYWLRQIGYDNLKSYMERDGNLLVCRQGRIFIKQSTGLRKPYHFKQSPWANEFVVGKGKHTLDESLFLYERWLDAVLQHTEVETEFRKLLQKRNIGCFCPLDQKCHVDIILKKLKQLA